MSRLSDFAQLQRIVFDPRRAVVLATLACQGFILAINGVAAPWMMRSFGLDQPAIARTFAWISLSALGAFALARRADRVGRRAILVWAVSLGSLAALGAALAASVFHSLLIFVVFDIVLLSTAGAAVTCSVVWIAEASSRDDRAVGQAVAGLALVAGSGPCLLLMPYLAGTDLSWPGLLFLSVSGIVLVPFLPRDTRPVDPAGGVTPAHASDRAFLLDQSRRSWTLTLVVTTVLSTIATASVDSWRYLHIVRDVGVRPATASALVVIAGIAGVIGFPLGALASDRVGRVPTVAGFMALMALAITWAFWGPPSEATHPWLWLGAGLAAASASGNAITVAANTAITELYPGTLRATIFGWLNLAGSIGRVAAQALVAAGAPRTGAASTAVGALALVGLPAAALFFRYVPETGYRHARSNPDRDGRDDVASGASGRSYSLGVRLALSAAVFTIGLVVFEGAVRLLARRAVMVPWQDDIQGIPAPKSNVRGRFAIADQFDTTVTIHDRFRSLHPISVEPAPHVRRVAVLGDSCAFGWGAEDDEAYPAVLERQLNASLGGEGPSEAEVLNAGVIGTGTGEQALWYDAWVKQFKPSIVVLTVFWNDVDDDVRGAFFEQKSREVQPRLPDVLERGSFALRTTRAIADHTPGFAWLSQHSQLLAWIRQAPTELFVSAHARAVGGADASTFARGAVLTPEELALFRGEIRWLRARVRPPSTLAIVFVPSAEAFDPTRAGAEDVVRKSAQIVGTLRQLASDDGVPFLDLQSVFGQRPDAKRLYFSHDPHPNATGYRAIGEAVASFLATEQLLPPVP